MSVIEAPDGGVGPLGVPQASFNQPYPGLRSFQAREASLFFGRARCVGELVATLERTRFLAVLGSSGSGKSSLIRTGLFQALNGGLALSAGSRWLMVDLAHPETQPHTNLARALLRAKGMKAPDTAAVEALRAQLWTSPLALRDWCRETDGEGRRVNLAAGENLLLLVDQFEEMFRKGDYKSRERMEAFVQLLIESARTVDAPIYVVLTMRSEFLGAAALVPELTDTINRGLFLTPWMSREECREAIEGPSRVMGFTVEPPLVNRLLNDIAKFAPPDAEGIDSAELLARQSDQLPLMQNVLNRLWGEASVQPDGSKILTRAAYDQLGGFNNALENHAKAVLKGLSPSASQIARKVFRALVSGASIATAVRRPRLFRDLVIECGGGDGPEAIREAVREVVDAFRQESCSFLTPADGILADGVQIDLSHESVIRQWSSLREWIEDEALAASRWRDLREKAREQVGERTWFLSRILWDGWLRGRELRSAGDWWSKDEPNAAWADRHGGEFSRVRAFVTGSQKAAAWRRRLGMGAAAIGFVVVGSMAAFAAAKDFEGRQRAQEAEQATRAYNEGMANAERDAVDLRRQAVAAREALDAAKAATSDAEARTAVAAIAELAANRRAEEARRKAIEFGDDLVYSQLKRLDAARLAKNVTPDAASSEFASAEEFLKKLKEEKTDTPLQWGNYYVRYADLQGDNQDPDSMIGFAQRAEQVLTDPKAKGLLEGVHSSEARALLAESIVMLGRAYSMKGDDARAEIEFRRALNVPGVGNPGDAKGRKTKDEDLARATGRAHVHLAELALRTKRYPEALQSAQNCIDVLKTANRQRALKVRCYTALGLAQAYADPKADFAKTFAEAETTSLVDFGPFDTDLAWTRGQVRYNLAWAEALAVRSSGSDAEIARRYGLALSAYRRLGQPNMEADRDLLADVNESRAGWRRRFESRDLAGNAATRSRTRFDEAAQFLNKAIEARQTFMGSGTRSNQALLRSSIDLLDRRIDLRADHEFAPDAFTPDIESYRVRVKRLTDKVGLLPAIDDRRRREAAVEGTRRQIDDLSRPFETSEFRAVLVTYPLAASGEVEGLHADISKLCKAAQDTGLGTVSDGCVQLRSRLERADAAGASARAAFNRQSGEFKGQGTRYATNEQSVTVDGYDVVRLNEETLVPGRLDQACVYRGAIWLFSTPETRQQFAANPRRYVPQYYGYARDIIGTGKALQPGEARFAQVRGKKLYLFAKQNPTFSEDPVDPVDQFWNLLFRPILKLSPLGWLRSGGTPQAVASSLPDCAGPAAPGNLGRQQVASARS